MMYRKPSRRWAALKAAYLLPLSILALVAFARPQAMDEIEKQLKKAEVQLVEAADHIGRKGDMAILWQETEDLMSPTIEPPAPSRHYRQTPLSCSAMPTSCLRIHMLPMSFKRSALP